MQLSQATGPRTQLYIADQRARRDASRWTLVQGVLAPAQFLAFAVSLALVLRFLATGDGYGAATASVLVKTGFLYLIMVTGAIWEKRSSASTFSPPPSFGKSCSASRLSPCIPCIFTRCGPGPFPPHGLMLTALAAYAAYLINAVQFILKLRRARLDTGGAA